ncbi:hypothetical protein V1519DRAFT_456998 [Lipomyces tetrasporus]
MEGAMEVCGGICAAAVHHKGAALDNGIAFIDVTVRPICRPNLHQTEVYNGHKVCSHITRR